MNKFIFLFSIFLIFFSCKKEEGKLVLPEEKMVKILSDLHISEAAAAHLSLTKRDSMTLVYLDQVLAIHNVPKATFLSDYNLLKKNPAKLEQTYKKVIDLLNELKMKKHEMERKRTKK